MAFYGHPGVFVTPSHEAIRRAREEGFPARMLPAISAEDCLFADLGVDPARSAARATRRPTSSSTRRRVDPTAALVLWQIGTVGRDAAAAGAAGRAGSRCSSSARELYPARPRGRRLRGLALPGFDPLITVPLSELSPPSTSRAMSTLYVPPLAPSADLTMLERLGLPRPE